jgi:RHS repeat-associated protein
MNILIFKRFRKVSSLITATCRWRPWACLLAAVLLHSVVAFGQSLQVTQTTNATDYAISEQGANYQVRQNTVPWTNQDGQASYQTNSYTELATGLNHLVNGQWVASSEDIQITAGGGAATNGQHQVYFAADINASNAVQIITPDGLQFNTHIMGLSYYDASTGSNVLFAELQDSTGQLVTNNQVVYPNAFANCDADVRYTYTRAGFEQDIVVQQQLPTPDTYGLNPAYTSLQVWTEFTDPPTPAITPILAGADERLDFGVMKMERGKAFIVGNESYSVPVNKTWTTVGGRTFLVEQVQFDDVATQLQGLPATSSGGGTNGTGIQQIRDQGFPKKLPPAPVLVKRANERLKLANTRTPEKGLVLDYTLGNSSVTNWTFAGNVTYYVIGNVLLYGTTTIEGGTVVKFTNSTFGLVIEGPVNCLTSPYQMAVFTAKDDDTEGGHVFLSSGSPSGYYAGTALADEYTGGSVTLQYLRISYANIACQFSTPKINWLKHSQFVNDGTVAFVPEGWLNIQNILADNIGNEVMEAFISTNSAVNMTVDQASQILNYSFGPPPGVLNVTNCLFASITNTGKPYSAVYSYTNLSDPGVFQTAGAGNYYLTNGSSYTNYGTTNIDPALLADLRNMTTHPPITPSNFTTSIIPLITTNTILVPTAARDTNSMLDLGYHYSPIDTMTTCDYSNCVVTLTNGVVLGFWRNVGILLDNGTQLVSQGSPLQRNVIAYYSLVQEQPIVLTGGITNADYYPAYAYPFYTEHYDTNQNPALYFRFTSIYVSQGEEWILNTTGGSDISNFTFRDCESYGGTSGWDLVTSGPVNIDNNLFQYSTFAANVSGAFGAFNNLARGALFYVYGYSGSTVTNRDNAFDGATVTLAGTNGYNAYLNGTTVTPAAATNDIIVTNFTWVTGPLGKFYQATNSPLINMGSTTADQLGLYHYTVTTNQVPETNATVTIGYHYVALGANGLPLDSNGDGIPDYLEDANGNGLVDNGETDWSAPPTITLVNPTNTSVFSAPATINLQAFATSGGVPVTNVIFYWGTLPIGSTTSGPTGGWSGNWSFNWTNVAAGVYSLTAVAQDAGGLSTTSAAVNITVTNSCSVTYSTNNNFGNSYWTNSTNAQGVVINLNYTNASGGLQIDGQIAPLPYVNVSCGADSPTNNSTDGTLLRIDAKTGAVLGEYHTAPQGKPSYPGHVAVDRYGNIWLANWDEGGVLDLTGMGSLTRIGIVIGGTRGYKTNDHGGTNFIFVPSTNGEYLQPPFEYCTAVDRDGDGLIKTSFGLGNILNWTNNPSAQSVTNSEDECVINYVRTTSQFNSGLTVDANNDVWVGGYADASTTDCSTGGSCPDVVGNESQEKINGITGQVLTTRLFSANGTNGTVYGGFDDLVDWNGVLWSTGGANNPNGTESLVRYNPGGNSTNILTGTYNYFGLAVDPVTGLIWSGLWGANSVNVYGTNESLITNYSSGGLEASCLAIDQQGSLWVSHRDGTDNNSISHLLTNGTNIGLVSLTNGATGPAGLSIDSYGKLWTVCYSSPTIARVDPAVGASYTNTNGAVFHLGTNDFSITLTNAHASMESYGDFTGYGLLSRAPAGAWSVVDDSGTLNQQWGTITWNASTADTNQVRVEVRAANLQAGLTANSFAMVTNSASLTNLAGEFLEIRVTLFKSPVSTNSPWLHDLTVACTPPPPTGPPAVSFLSPTNNQLIVLLYATNIMLQATASESNGTISGVQCFVIGGGVTNSLGSVGTQTNQIYQFLWTNVTAGTYTLSATATDANSATATAAVTNIVVDYAPVVTITAPTNFAYFSPGTSVTNWAHATDSNGVSRVDFYSMDTNGFTLIGSVTNLANPTNITNSLPMSTPPGTYAVCATATDTYGAVGVSKIVVFQVGAPPWVNITYPANGQKFQPDTTITITATAGTTNIGGSITNVDFFVNGQFIGSDTVAPYNITQCCWKPGTYVLSARATDNLGLQTVSSNITIIVMGEIPTPQNGFWDENFGSYAYSALNAPESDEWNPVSVYFAPDGTLFAPTTYAAWAPVWGIAYATPPDYTDWAIQSNLTYADWLAPMSYVTDGTNHYACGRELETPGYVEVNVVGWTGTNITAYTNVGSTSPVGVPTTLLLFNGSLYVGGGMGYEPDYELGQSHNDGVQRINIFDPSSDNWLPVGDAVYNGAILAMAVFQNELYIGGSFTNVGVNSNVSYIAKLVGTNWVNVGGGVSSTGCHAGGIVTALKACGTNLFVGGYFDTVGGTTAASGVAIWNGETWLSLGGGVAPVDCPDGSYDFENSIYYEDTTGTYPNVYALTVRGNRLYVAGDFTQIFNGTDPVAANSIATALWDENQQMWTWSDMDSGVLFSPFSSSEGNVFSLTINEFGTNGAYDLYVTGMFTNVGTSQMPDAYIARWRVGSPNTNANAGPTVQITSPTNYVVYTNPASITVGVAVTWLTTNDPPSPASLYANGTLIGTTNEYLFDTNFISHYNFVWTNLSNGVYSLQATADENREGLSPLVYVSIKGTNNPVVAHDDIYTVLMNTATNLYVLTNDSSSNGPLHIAAVTPVGETEGTVSLWANGRFLTYNPAPYEYGHDTFTYIAEDAYGNSDSAHVTVNVLAPPGITMLVGSSGSSGIYSTTNVIPVTNFVTGFDAPVTNVTVYVNGTNAFQTTSTNLGNSGFNWSDSVANIYTFWAVAMDADGITNISGPVTILLTNTNTASSNLTASINNLPITVGLVTNYYVVQQGLFDLQGQARMTGSNSTLAYQLMLFRPQDNGDIGLDDTTVPYLNVTPVPPGGALNASGFRPGGDSGGDLGMLNLSGIPNGVYDLQLTVEGNGAEISVVSRFMLDTQMKIGELTFSQQDLSLSANGIPLTVTRTYNSMNPQSADFGYGWTYVVNGMNVQLDEQRSTYNRGDPHLALDDSLDDANDGGPSSISIRTGGGRNVTLTLPNGRQTTFQFEPQPAGQGYEAQWIPPSDVHATLETTGLPGIDTLLGLYWDDGGFGSSWDNYDVPGWKLTTQDGTQYLITRQDEGAVTYQPDPFGNPGGSVAVEPYGPPQLTEIDERTGDKIMISPAGMTHIDASNNPTRSVYFKRDGQNRITALFDPDSGSNGLPVVQYVYDQDTGNLLQVLKLTDRTAGTYVTNSYRYDNPNFPHYITAIQDADGVPVAENQYDSNGLLISSTDADGNVTRFIHNTSNQVDVVVDRAGNTNSYAYDTNGNVTIITNALGQVTTMAYDALNDKTNEVIGGLQTNNYSYDISTGFMLQSIIGGLMTNTFTYNGNGQVLTSTDGNGNVTANNYDSSGNLTNTATALSTNTYTYYSSGQLASTVDALGNVTTNYYDGSGNLTATAVLDTSNTILSTNSYAYDANGNQTNSTVWRRVSGTWTPATTVYVYDGQNRVVQTIDPNGFTNAVVYDNNGRQSVTIDALNRPTQYFYDTRGNLTNTIYPDTTFEQSAYDQDSRRTNSTDRAGNVTTYVYDALSRVYQTVFPDTTTNTTVYDAAGRVAYTLDAFGITNAAYGYDAAGRQTSVTNAWGISGLQMVTTYGYDSNGNQTNMVDNLSRTNSYFFDALNRMTSTTFPDTTTQLTTYDADGRKIAQTDQASVTTEFGYDGAGRLIVVTNAVGTGQQAVTHYAYDEAGNQITQVDALGRTNAFVYDGLGRRTQHVLPGTQSETFSYDAVGNLVSHTDFNGLVITNGYDSMNRLTNRGTATTTLELYGYNVNGQMSTRTDTSGSYTWNYDTRDRLKTNGTPVGTLYYLYDANGNLTNLASATTNGVSTGYQYDALNRLTNVVDYGLSGTKISAYTFDKVGNLQTLQYPNGLTNLYQYDSLNRLTNLTWKLTTTTLGTFYYRLGTSGNRTNLSETLDNTNRTFAWNYDNLYRLTNEALSVSAPIGAIGYQFDAVGNRTNRTSTVSGIAAQTLAYGTNDWLTNDVYDSNGNTRTNGSNVYLYDYANRLTNANSGATVLVYDADGNRIKKVAGGTTTLYLVSTENPSGYAQVVEEFTVPGTTNLSKVYTYGMSLISQRVPGTSTNFFGLDGHGSTRFLTDAGGNVANAFIYDTYGNLIASNTAPQTAYLYCEEQLDQNLGFYYLRARYMGPNTGRFLTMDTDQGDQEDPPSLHKYLYGADNPVNLDDPSGNDYGDFDINISSILAPLSSQLYASTSGQALNVISGLGGFAPAELVDVYTWRTHILQLAMKSRAGHVMMTHHDDTTGPPLLSQFPCKDHSGDYGFINKVKMIGYNGTFSFQKTVGYETNHPPSHIFEVSIPGAEVAAFNNAIEVQHNIEYWQSFPNGKNETECSTSVCYALEQARILPPGTWTSGLLLPSKFDTLMMGEARRAGSGVTLLKTHAFLSPTGQ